MKMRISGTVRGTGRSFLKNLAKIEGEVKDILHLLLPVKAVKSE